ncbi:hypothetical protein Vadar_006481 [Vaccinium darrowii]|uniref:Uncharacterized protein n=1 Tax=Vaccinium darrowii TaxID=229202 RepID=A0ACB7ZHK5_9ERIC|nr:hypothetical protein Vadar_006481 [Vaccinium darrowii]
MNISEWNASLQGADPRPTGFSLEVHYSGVFELRHTEKVYIGGQIETIHGLDPDYISMLELDAMGEKLGYAPHVAFYFKKPKRTLDNGLVPLISDKDAYGMTQGLDKDRITVMFVEHIGGVKLVESQVGSSNEVFGLDLEGQTQGDQGIGTLESQMVDEVDIEVDNDEVDYSDSSSDSVYYSDHSYQEGDDDHSYETFVDDESEFVGFPIKH